MDRFSRKWVPFSSPLFLLPPDPNYISDDSWPQQRASKGWEREGKGYLPVLVAIPYRHAVNIDRRKLGLGLFYCTAQSLSKPSFIDTNCKTAKSSEMLNSLTIFCLLVGMICPTQEETECIFKLLYCMPAAMRLWLSQCKKL